jgi:hypothetical protein
MDFLYKEAWIHQGNINKVKKLIMSSNEFNILRIQALEKRVKELEEELKQAKGNESNSVLASNTSDNNSNN